MKKRVIVSMTSYPERIGMAFGSVRRLECQTVKPDKVVLYLSEDEFPGRLLPEDVVPYTGKLDFEIHWVEQNLRPHNKYYYAFKEYRNDHIITIDDDIVYDNDMIKCFTDNVKRFPKAVLSMRVHLITRDGLGNIESYDNWAQKCYEYVNEPRMDLLATGVGGCLYDPSLFDDEVFHINNIVENCLCTDDLWLKIMQLLSGIPVVLIADRPKFKDPGEAGLYSMVNKCGGNDLSWKKTWEIYKDFKGNKGILGQKIGMDKLLTAEEAKNILLYKAKNVFLSFWEKNIGEQKICLYGAGKWAQRMIRVLDHLDKGLWIDSLFVKNTDDNFNEVYGLKVRPIDTYNGEDRIIVALADSSKLKIFYQLIRSNAVDPSQIVLLEPEIYEALNVIDQSIGIEKYKVSVIVPVYQVEQYLGQCLDSIRRQTLEDIEILCINDHSNDRSMEVLEMYGQSDKRIKIFENHVNKGLSATRNIGIGLARGKYICFVDSDDLLDADALEMLYSTAEEKNTDIIVYGVKSFRDNDHEEQHEYFFNRLSTNRIMLGKDLFAEMMRTGDMRVMAQTQFWKRQSLNGLGLRFYEGILHEDTLFSYMGYVRVKRAMCVPFSFYQYRLRSDSITGKKPGEQVITSMLTIYQEVLKYWIAHPKDNIDEVSIRFLRGRKNILNEKVSVMSCSLEEIFHRSGEFSLSSFILDLLLEDKNKAVNFLGKENYYKLISNKANYIYGAGKIAREVIHIMKEVDIDIDGILVSGLDGNPEKIQDIPVTCMADVDIEKIRLGNVILGVGKRNMTGVIENLEKYGIEDFMILPRYRE